MRCSSCNSENPENMRFCGACGKPLSVLCPSCGGKNPPQFKFCGHCATELPKAKGIPAPATGPALDSPQNETSAERRHLTVLFCDLVDSTALSDQLDPEDLHLLVRDYQAAAATVIERLDGHIAQYLGDGVLVYFGFPNAHEDDARRAVQAGLAIVAAIRELSDRLEKEQGPRLAVRVGIHTGLVVTGEIGSGKRREQLALGPVPNIAARLQGMAEPNTVVLSSVTYELVQGYFSCESIGVHDIKGISKPLETFQALQESAIQSRFELAVSRGLSPMVGRHEELSQLLESFGFAREGEGRVVFIGGEAGIGKSRLVHALRERIERSCTWWTCYGSPLDRNRALYPLFNLTRKILGFEKRDTPQQTAAKLEGVLERSGLQEEAAPLLSAFLSLGLTDRYPPLGLPADVQREKTLEVLLSLLLPEDDQPPLVLLVEDLQWLDPSTLEFLNLLIDRTAAKRVLVLLTARPAFTPQWSYRANLNEIRLERIAVRHIEELVKELTGGRKLPDTILRHLVEKTDGVPLFVEEITRSVLESGLLTPRNGHFVLAKPLQPLEIPTTLQGTLIARLDRMGRAKEVAQIAAAIGRRFSFGLLSAVAPMDEESLTQELDRLVEAQLVRRKTQSASGGAFIFNHALIRDAAYDSLVAAEQRRLHRKIASALEQRLTDGAATEADPSLRKSPRWEEEERDESILAYHWSRVIDRRRPDPTLARRAVAYLHKAGERQLQLSAYEEASRLLREALDLTGLLPEGPERDQHELDLQIALSTAIRPLESWDSPVLMATCRRARELCGRIGTAVQLAPVLYGMWGDRLTQLDLDRAYNIACELQDLAEKVGEADIAVQAHLTKGQVHFWRGEFSSCRQYMDLALMALKEHRVLHLYQQHFGHEPLTVALMFAVHSAWLLGDVDEADRSMATLLEYAESLDHPFSLAIAVQAAAWARYHAADVESTRKHAEHLISLCETHDFAFYRAAGHLFHGWAVAVRTDPDAGIAELRQGFDEGFRTFGGKGPEMLYHLQQAEAHLVAEGHSAGLDFVNAGLEAAHQHNAMVYAAEFYRLRGELLGGESPEAEAAFRTAIETAQHQQAKMYELRAALSLALLLRQRNESESARRLVAETASDISVSLETRDLERARLFLADNCSH